MEVPEINSGIVEIFSIAREAGSRTKIAVYSKDEAVDPLGACVGYKGARVKAIVDELHEEKIDIVICEKEIGKFIRNALSPSKVVKVFVNDEEKSALVVVPDYQLSLAIGKEGQNARLAARLTNWKIDIKSEEQFYGFLESENISEEDLKEKYGLELRDENLDESEYVVVYEDENHSDDYGEESIYESEDEDEFNEDDGVDQE